MRNKCLFSLGLVFVISLTSMVAFAFSFVGTPADEVDSRDIIVQSMISDEANATPTATSVATTAPEQETEKAERSKIGSMDWDSDDAYRLAKIAMAEAESEDTEGKALVMLVVLNRVWSDEFPDTIEDVIFQKGQFSPISNGRYDEVEPDEDCYRALQLIQTGGWDESHGATYFESKSDSTWHSENLTFLFKHAIHHRIGRSEPTGTTYITRFGNTRQKNVFKEFYKTNIGEFTPEKWLEVTLQIIQTLMENELLEEINEHVAGHCVWLKNDKEIEEYSASCLASGAYMYWEDFKDKRLPAHKVFIFEGGDF